MIVVCVDHDRVIIDHQTLNRATNVHQPPVNAQQARISYPQICRHYTYHSARIALIANTPLCIYVEAAVIKYHNN